MQKGRTDEERSELSIHACTVISKIFSSIVLPGVHNMIFMVSSVYKNMIWIKKKEGKDNQNNIN
jgi:hypothetical protein